MKPSTIILFAIFLISTLCQDSNNYCSNLRIGTKKGATDVVLDGAPTTQYHQYRRIKDEDDVEVDSRTNESFFFLSGVKLENIPELNTEIARDRLVTIDSNIAKVGDGNSEFKITINYNCAEDLAGVTDVYLTVVLDGEACDTVGESIF